MLFAPTISLYQPRLQMDTLGKGLPQDEQKAN